MQIVNSIASSSASFKKGRCTMEFGPTWGKGAIFDWYRKELPKKPMINRLEVRITRGTIPHRFVVAYLGDKAVCRFDRRPQNPNLLEIVHTATVKDESCPAADEVCLGNGSDAEFISSFLEINLILPQDIEVSIILSACFAISCDEKARNYSLLEYNCYFFSWTIVMLVTRHLLPFSPPSADAVRARWNARVENGSAVVSDIIIKALSGILFNTLSIVEDITGKRLHRGLGKRELAVWGLPMPVFHALLRQCLKIRVHCSLKKQLDNRLRHQLDIRAAPIIAALLSGSCNPVTENEDTKKEGLHRGFTNAVQQRLWLTELASDLRQPIHQEVLRIVWDSILEAISDGYGEVEQDMIREIIDRLPVMQRLKHRLLGKNVMQFCQIWGESFRAALPAARVAGHGQFSPGKSHEEMFDLAFTAGAAEVLRTAKQVVAKTSPELENPKRDEMWQFVWSVWDTIWDQTRLGARTKIAKVIRDTMTEIEGWVAEDVVKEVGDKEEQKVEVMIQFKKTKLLHSHRQRRPNKALSLELFQLNIRKFIQSVPGQTLEHSANIEEAMSRAWELSRRTYQPLSEVSL